MNAMGKVFAGVALAAAGVAAVAANAQQPRLGRTGDGRGIAHGGAAAVPGNVARGRAAWLVGGGGDTTALFTGPDAALGGGAPLACAEPAPAAAMAEGGPDAGERRG